MFYRNPMNNVIYIIDLEYCYFEFYNILGDGHSSHVITLVLKICVRFLFYKTCFEVIVMFVLLNG